MQEINKQFKEVINKHGDKYRLVNKDMVFEIQYKYGKANGFWANIETIKKEPKVGFFSIIGLGYKQFNNQETYAKKCFIDYIYEKTRKEIVKIID